MNNPLSRNVENEQTITRINPREPRTTNLSLNQIYPVESHENRQCSSRALKSDSKLQEWIQDHFVGPLLKKARSRYTGPTPPVCYHDHGYLFGKNKWFDNIFSNFYVAVVLFTTILRFGSIAVFFATVDPKDLKTRTTLGCGVAYCLFTILRNSLTLFDSIYKVAKKSKKHNKKREGLVIAKDCLNILFHLIAIIGLISIWYMKASRPTVDPYLISSGLYKLPRSRTITVLCLINLFITVIQTLVCFILVFYGENTRFRKMLSLKDLYCNMSQWGSWAVILGMIRFEFVLTQAPFAFGSAVLCSTLMGPGLILRALLNMFKNPSERIFDFQMIFCTVFVSFPGILAYFSHSLLNWSRKYQWGTTKKIGCLISVGMMVVTAIFIVRLKKFKVKCPDWINEQIKVYEEDKKVRDKRIMRLERLEKLKKSQSIYRIGENLYREKKEEGENKSGPPPQKKRTLQMCGICFAAPSNCLFKPCNHGGICAGCAKKVFEKKKACPFCREKVTKIVVYKQLDLTGDKKIEKYAKIMEIGINR